MIEFLSSAWTATVDTLTALMPLGFPFWGLILILAIGIAARVLVKGRTRPTESSEDSDFDPIDV
jgi:hypothetical protein